MFRATDDYSDNQQIYSLAPPARADCLKNSVFQIHGIGPGPIAKPKIYPMTQTIERYGTHGAALSWFKTATIAKQLKISVNFVLSIRWIDFFGLLTWSKNKHLSWQLFRVIDEIRVSACSKNRQIRIINLFEKPTNLENQFIRIIVKFELSTYRSNQWIRVIDLFEKSTTWNQFSRVIDWFGLLTYSNNSGNWLTRKS